MTGRPSDYGRVQELFDRIAGLSADEAEAVARQLSDDDALIAEALELARFDRASASGGGSAADSSATSSGSSVGKSEAGRRPSAAVSVLLPGARVGNHELMEPASSGASGDVWLGRGPTQERVAIKVGRPGSEGDVLALEGERLRDWRLRELPSYVAHGELATGQRYLVTEWLDGGAIDAAELLKPGVDPVDVANRCMRALGALHDGGYAHGDLKPAHLRLTSDGDVRLLDLGSSGLEGGAEPTPCTPRWAAPERTDGGPPSASSDVYSLAAILQQTMPWTRLDERFGNSDRLKSVLEHAASEAPEDRPGTASELLERWQAAARSATSIRRRRRAYWLALAGAVGAGFLALLVAQGNRERRDLVSTVPTLLGSGPKDVEIERWVDSGAEERVELLSLLAHQALDRGDVDAAELRLGAAERAVRAGGPVAARGLESLAFAWLRLECPARAEPHLQALIEGQGPSPRTKELRAAALMQRGAKAGDWRESLQLVGETGVRSLEGKRVLARELAATDMGAATALARELGGGGAVLACDLHLAPFREVRIDADRWSSVKEVVFAALEASSTALGPGAPRAADQYLAASRAALQVRDVQSSLRAADALASQERTESRQATDAAWMRARTHLLSGEPQRAHESLSAAASLSPIDDAINKVLLAVSSPENKRDQAGAAARQALDELSAATDAAGQRVTAALLECLMSSADPVDVAEAAVEALETLRNLDVPEHVRIVHAICGFPVPLYPHAPSLEALLDLGVEAARGHAETGSLEDAEFAIWMTQELILRGVFRPLPGLGRAFGASDSPWGADVAQVIQGIAPMSERTPDIGAFATRMKGDVVDRCRERVAASTDGAGRHPLAERLLIHFAMRVRNDLGKGSAALWWELIGPTAGD